MWRGTRIASVSLGVSVLVTVLLAAPQAAAKAAVSDSYSPNSEPSIVRVYYKNLADLKEISGYDLLEHNDKRLQYVLVLADEDDLRSIREKGFLVEVDRDRTERLLRKPAIDEAQIAGIPGFPCYRTVEETYAVARSLERDYSSLADWIDVGDSWEKTDGPGGHDLMVLRLTNSAIAGPKPKMFVTGSIHGREYTPAELTTRFAEHLVYGYGANADVTWLLDHHEIHLMLMANPDARKMAETGLWWRKNTNENYCTPTSQSRGVDLNRNFDFEWGCCGGSGSSGCDSTYRGPAPASDPETQAIAAYMLSVFEDQRDPALDAPAPLDATGIYLDVHSSGRLVLWPWGFGGTAPNADQLQTLGRKLAFFNSYTPQQGVDLYITDGTTTDFSYGELGIASFTYELGTEFFQDCTNFETVILPDNLDSLVYAAKVARTPYITPSGPDAVDVQLDSVVVDAGQPVTLTARIDDARFSGVGEPVQAIAAAEYYVDVPPWSDSALPVAIPIQAVDGAYDASVEEVSAIVDTTGLGLGRHTLFVRGRDVDGNWGAVSAALLHVDDGSAGRAIGTVREVTSAGALAATVIVEELGARTISDPATGAYAMRLPNGVWTLSASTPDHLPLTVSGVSITDFVDTVTDFDLTLAPPILLVDDDDNAPDVRQEYTDALDAMGEEYFVWDTANSDREPDLKFLEAFESAIWFTGDAWGGFTGPGPHTEPELGAWLDSGRCLFLSSQDYFIDRGLTPFMSDYLGVGEVTNNANHNHVTGLGTVYGQTGTYQLFFPYANQTDILLPGPSAETAFGGTYGSAAVNKDSGWFRTTYVGFGIEALPTLTNRRTVLTSFFDWCADLALADGDADGTANGEDCAPTNPLVWTAPSPVTDLRLKAGDTDNLVWSPPSSPGATAPLYDVLRSPEAEGFATAVCVSSGGTGLAATDVATPAPGQRLHYLLRVRNPCGTAMGTASSGAIRLAPLCP
jgi:hypothetical protein